MADRPPVDPLRDESAVEYARRYNRRAGVTVDPMAERAWRPRVASPAVPRPEGHPFVPGTAPTDEFDNDYAERCHRPEGRGLICGRPASEHASPAVPRPEGPYTVRKIEDTADDWWDVLDANGGKIALSGEDDARRIAAALNAAAPRPEGLDVERLARALENVEGLDPEYGDDERLYLAHQIAANLRLSDTGDTPSGGTARE